jgi:hypothetical protein
MVPPHSDGDVRPKRTIDRALAHPTAAKWGSRRLVVSAESSASLGRQRSRGGGRRAKLASKRQAAGRAAAPRAAPGTDSPSDVGANEGREAGSRPGSLPQGRPVAEPDAPEIDRSSRPTRCKGRARGGKGRIAPRRQTSIDCWVHTRTRADDSSTPPRLKGSPPQPAFHLPHSQPAGHPFPSLPSTNGHTDLLPFPTRA